MLASLKLLDLMANHSESIAALWAKDVVKKCQNSFLSLCEQ